MAAFELRSYQIDLANKGLAILRQHGLTYLAMQPRTGKTLTALQIAKLYGAKRVLVLTKLKAIDSIKSDYAQLNPGFRITVWNYESLHKLVWDFDLIICDEAHVLSAYAKPSKRTKQLKEFVNHIPIIYLSATPTAESYSQIYHQLWISNRSPFARWSNFYKFAKEFVNVKKKWLSGFQINDYSDAKEKEIMAIIKPLMISFSQEEAGFKSVVEEKIIYCPIDERLYQLMKILKKDKVYTLKSGDTIVADTPVRLQSIMHQLSSGSVITGEDATRKYHILDRSKALFIKKEFAGKKMCIFYKYISEGNILREVFPNYTDSPEEFNSRSDLHFICQFASGSLGTNVSSADVLIAYNIDFSATIYFQFKERTQTFTREKNSPLYWIFSEHGIEKYIYEAVSNKLDFTNIYFKKIAGKIGQLSLV